MIKVLALILAAFILGASMMLLPLALFVCADVKIQENQHLLGGTNQTQPQTEGKTYGDTSFSFGNATGNYVDLSRFWQNFEEVRKDAFAYGQMDIEPASFTLSMNRAALLIVVSLAVATVVSFYFKRRMELL